MMNKIIIFTMLAGLFLAGCKKNNEELSYEHVGNPVNQGKALVAYFSRTNTTETVANRIVELTGADIFEIQVVNPYPENYDETTRVARREKDNNTRPAIANEVENIDEYDTIFVGFPIWWSSRPMVIATFLETYDLTGKNVIPFCTHGGGGYGAAFREVVTHTPGSTHVRGLATQGAASQSQIEDWLNGILL